MESLCINKDSTITEVPFEMFASYAKALSARYGKDAGMFQVMNHSMIVIDDIKSTNITSDDKADIYLQKGHAYISLQADSIVRIGLPNGRDVYIHASLDQKELVISFAPIVRSENKADGMVAAWLAGGDRGRSSEAMCKHFFGVPVDAGKHHPHDPSDFQRCMRFLDATNSHHWVPSMSIVSLEWAMLANNWDELSALYEKESNQDKALLLYARMNELLAESSDHRCNDGQDMRP